ncbi:Probable amino-acid metabolite efflux pump [Mycobacteroides abscessus subsp. abscessus]|nr:Probable amino-acid metabolite efflux pump [Mycobacteroides abscessus subsp. abscessus]HEO8422255.1 DMT family transporter [Yersinia enterocolitica]
MKHYFILVFCVVIWAANYLVRQLLLTNFSSMFLSAFSLTVVSLFFIIIVFFMNAFVRVTKKELILFFLAGLIGLVFNQLFLFSGLQYSTASNASLIFSMAPLITALLARVILKEKITRNLIIGSIIALLGVYFVLSANGRFQYNIGDILLFGATVTFSCNLIFVRMLSKGISPLIITTYSFLIAILMFDPFILVSVDINWNQPLIMWLIAFLSVLIGQGITTLMWNNTMQSVGAAKSTVVLNLQPIITLLLDYWIYDTKISILQLIGTTLVIYGVLLSVIRYELFGRKRFSLLLFKKSKY